MASAIAAVVFVVAMVLLVSWLGSGRKWAFRTMLSLLVLGLLGACGVFGYVLWTEKSAERQRQRIHECAIDKIARARCVSQEPQPLTARPAIPSSGPWEKYKRKTDLSKEVVWDVCPPYMLAENPTPEQEADAMTAAEKACWAEISSGHGFDWSGCGGAGRAAVCGRGSFAGAVIHAKLKVIVATRLLPLSSHPQ